MANTFQKACATIAVTLLASVTLQARQPQDAGVIAKFQRAADSYAFQHRQTERRGTPPAPSVEGAFFTPLVAAAFRHRIRTSGCEIPQTGEGDSAVPRPNDFTDGTSPLAPCLVAVLPSLPAELEYRTRGIALVLADAHLKIVVDVLHAAFPQARSVRLKPAPHLGPCGIRLADRLALRISNTIGSSDTATMPSATSEKLSLTIGTLPNR